MVIDVPLPVTEARSDMYRLPPSRPLTPMPVSRIIRLSTDRIRSSLIRLDVVLPCRVEPEVCPAAASHGRWLMKRFDSVTYVSSPQLLLRRTPGTMIALNCCDTIQRFVMSVFVSFSAVHSKCGVLPKRKRGEPSGSHASRMSVVGGMSIIW